MELLTKDDLEFLDRIGAWTHVGLKGKILKNQEDAFKYELMMTPTAKDIEKALQSVERLEKLSPEIIRKAECLDDYHTGNSIKELIQEIIGEGNENN